MKRFLCASLLVTIFLLQSCFRSRQIEFDESIPLATAPDVEWAVVMEPYVAYRDLPDWYADSNMHCRKGDILQVQGMSVNNENEYWYDFENGWLPASAIAVYSNRLKAQAAKEQLK